VKIFSGICLILILHQPLALSFEGESSHIPDGPGGEVEQFFSQLIRGEDETAVMDLFSQSPISREGSAIEKTASQLKLIRNLYGKIESIEHIDVVYRGKSLFRLRVLVFYREFPIRFIFTYYKSPLEQKWILGYFSFDDQIQRLFDDDPDP